MTLSQRIELGEQSAGCLPFMRNRDNGTSNHQVPCPSHSK